jgi:homoserine O-acetyltransferase
MVRPLLALLLTAAGWAQTTPPAAVASGLNPTEGDYLVRDFRFQSGEMLAELRLHYTTLGRPKRDAAGRVENAVLILHGTGGNGRAFLGDGFAGVLFGKDQPLDSNRYYIILPDAVGHGQSSKPSDGLHARFPHYRYDDLVRACYQLVHDGLSVDHLRLVMGTSMGAMHTWLWGETYSGFMDALMPLASAPVEIAGRNRMFRDMVIDSIRSDPDWKDGEYVAPPRGLLAARFAIFMMTSSPEQLHRQNPTREKADAAFQALKEQALRLDANDTLYQYEASAGYDPAPKLDRIRAPLFAINSADDEVNPPELGILEREIRHVPRGRYILIPTSPETRGHGTHSLPAIWKNYLIELLRISEPAHSAESSNR